MYVTMLKSKIHRATVTMADLSYVGSITIDRTLAEAVNIMENERVQVVNNHNGERFETYVIYGERDSGIICLNGAAARLVQKGDVIIIMAYAMMDAQEAKQHKPAILIADENNKIAKLDGK